MRITTILNQIQSYNFLLQNIAWLETQLYLPLKHDFDKLKDSLDKLKS